MTVKTAREAELNKQENRGENFTALLGLMKLKRGDLLYSNKRVRTHKNEFQKGVLIDIFAITRFPSSETREDLALLLNHTARGIQIWFQNNRHNTLGIENSENNGKKRSSLEIFEETQTKKMSIERSILCDIVEKHLSKNSKEYWDRFINYESDLNE